MFKDTLKNYSGGKILDVGTGRGELIIYLKEAFKNYEEIIGIDSSKKSIEFCREQFKDNNVSFMEMNGDNMGFAEETFDTVCISNSLHHMNSEEMHKVLNEMKRVLKPEGFFIICEMYRDNQSPSQMSHVYLHHLSAEMDRLRGITHNDTFKRDEIINIAKEIDLELANILDYVDEEKVEKEELDSIESSFEKRIKNLEKESNYSSLKCKMEKLKDNMSKFGLSGATELIIIGRKNRP